MAIVLIEGFDHFAAADMTSKGWSVNTSSMQTGRFSGQAARMGTTASTKSLPSSYSTAIVGFAFRTNTTGAKTTLLDLRAGATRTMRFQQDASNHIQIANSSGTIIATGTTALNTNTFYYVEVKLVVNGASGSCEVHLNGVSGEIAATTGNFGSTNVDTIAIVGVSAQTTDYDDIYVADTTGSAPRNTFLGDVRVSTVAPTGAGAHSQFTPNGAANNWDCVDEEPSDSDSTYVSDANVGDIDTYAFADIDGGATVYGVQPCLFARKDDASTRQLAPVIRQGGSDNAGTTVTLSSSYTYYTQIYNQDPTSADWTAGNVNADEFGVKVIA